MIDTLSLEDHKARHLILHKHLDELVADMINHTSRLPSSTTVSELMTWSHEQTTAPTVKER